MGGQASHPQAEVSGVDDMDWAIEIAQSITAGTAEGFSARLSTLKERDVAAAVSAFNEVYWGQPEAGFPWLTSLIEALDKAGAHPQAAMVLGLVDIDQDVIGLERALYDRWITQGGEGLRGLLEPWIEREDGAHKEISIVASLYQAEHVDRFGDYLAWIDNSPVAIKGVLVQHLLPHLERRHLDAAEDLIVAHLDHESFAHALYALAERWAEEDAEATLAWVAKIPVDRLQLGVKMEAFGTVIRVLAHEDLDAAEAILKQPGFVPRYFPAERVRMTNAEGGWSRLGHWFHDESWRHFIDVALESDPKRAEEASKGILDPQALKDYRQFFLNNY